MFLKKMIGMKHITALGRYTVYEGVANHKREWQCVGTMFKWPPEGGWN